MSDYALHTSSHGGGLPIAVELVYGNAKEVAAPPETSGARGRVPPHRGATPTKSQARPSAERGKVADSAGSHGAALGRAQRAAARSRAFVGARGRLVAILGSGRRVGVGARRRQRCAAGGGPAVVHP